MESVSIFPPPPGYSALFAEDDGEDLSFRTTRGFPFQPPTLAEGQHVVFGELQETQTGIPKLTVKQLFDQNELDAKKELHRLHEEVLTTYSELIKTVVHQPERYARLTERIGVLIRNMIQLVNLMRPCQAVASMEEFLKESVKNRECGLKEVEKCKDDCMALLNESLLDSVELL